MIIGIDPGLDGAIAVINANGGVLVHDMPTVPVSTSRKEVDTVVLYDLLGGLPRPKLCTVEQVGANPKFGASRSFNFGMGFGKLLACLEILNWPVYRITPNVWKKAMLEGTDHSKAASVSRVNQLYPHLKYKTSDHDKAEAILLALYGREKFKR